MQKKSTCRTIEECGEPLQEEGRAGKADDKPAEYKSELPPGEQGSSQEEVQHLCQVINIYCCGYAIRQNRTPMLVPCVLSIIQEPLD